MSRAGRRLSFGLLPDLDIQPFDFLIQRRKRDVEAFGGLSLAPVAALQALDDDAALVIVEDLEQRGVLGQRRAVAAVDADAVGGKERVGRTPSGTSGSEASTTARSTTFSSSRTLPGQLCSISTCMASGSKRSTERPEASRNFAFSRQ